MVAKTSTPVPLKDHKVVSQEEWDKARAELLVKEKALTKQRDALALEIRNLPWEVTNFEGECVALFGESFFFDEELGAGFVPFFLGHDFVVFQGHGCGSFRDHLNLVNSK